VHQIDRRRAGEKRVTARARVSDCFPFREREREGDAEKGGEAEGACSKLEDGKPSGLLTQSDGDRMEGIAYQRANASFISRISRDLYLYLERDR